MINIFPFEIISASQKNEKGAGLLELILAVGVFAIGVLTFSHIFLFSHDSTLYNINENEALDLSREGLEAVRSIRNNAFNDLSPGNYELSLSGGNWILVELIGEPSEINERYKRTITISDYETDEKRKIITSAVTWDEGEESVSLTEHLTAWQEIAYTLTMAESPTAGGTATDVTNTSPYTEGAIVDILASPAGGYGFTEWTTLDGGTFASSAHANTTYTMPGNAATITANFAEE